MYSQWEYTLLGDKDLEDVEAENIGRSEQEERLASLRKWKASCGNDATYAALMNAMVEFQSSFPAPKIRKTRPVLSE